MTSRRRWSACSRPAATRIRAQVSVELEPIYEPKLLRPLAEDERCIFLRLKKDDVGSVRDRLGLSTVAQFLTRLLRGDPYLSDRNRSDKGRDQARSRRTCILDAGPFEIRCQSLISSRGVWAKA